MFVLEGFSGISRLDFQAEAMDHAACTLALYSGRQAAGRCRVGIREEERQR